MMYLGVCLDKDLNSIEDRLMIETKLLAKRAFEQLRMLCLYYLDGHPF